MFVALRSLIRLPWIGRIAVVPVFAAVSVCAQSGAAPAMPASLAAPAAAASSEGGYAAPQGQPAQIKPESAAQETPPAPATGAAAAPSSQAPANEAAQASCPLSPDMDLPLSSTIVAKVIGLLDSGHLKVGKEIWVRVVNGLAYPGCTLNAGAALYGHVTAAVAQKNPSSSELSLAFDHADCEGHAKKEMPLRLIALVAPPEESASMHEAAPLVMQGGSRSAGISDLAAIFPDGRLNPGGTPNTVRPGTVVGMPKVTLEIAGGPGCSARISSTKRSVELDPGAELILIAQVAP